MLRGERWKSWALKASALGSPLPEVPSWARRDPRLADYEWAIVAALAERLGSPDEVGIVEVSLEQIARQIVDPHPAQDDLVELGLALSRLSRLGLVATGKGTLVLRPQVIPLSTRPEPHFLSDEALLEWVDTLPELERLRARAAHEKALASLAAIGVSG